MWWAPTGKVMQVFAGHADRVNAGCFANAGKCIATGAVSGEVIIWNPRQGTATHNLQLYQDQVLCIEAHPKEPVVVAGGFDGTCVVVHVETGKTLTTLKGHEHEVEAVSFFHGDLPLLATGGIDGTVRVWETNRWELRVSVNAHKELQGGVTRLAWHPTQPVVLSAGTDCMVRAHDARSGQQLRVLSGHRKEILDLASVQVGDAVVLLSAGDDKTARMFRL
jgi:WD40 repeat protein